MFHGGDGVFRVMCSVSFLPHIGPHLSILRENGCRSERRIDLTRGRASDFWNIRIWPIPAYKWWGLDKCSGWIRSSLTCYALVIPGSEASSTEVKHGEKKHWQEDELFWDGARHSGSAGTSKFTNAMLCKTEQAKIKAHTFSGVYSLMTAEVCLIIIFRLGQIVL